MNDNENSLFDACWQTTNDKRKSLPAHTLNFHESLNFAIVNLTYC